MIHTLTLNPALDKIIRLDEFQKNITNRINSTSLEMGGKGTHVSVNLALMGEENMAHGICHGETGYKLISMLEKAGVISQFLHDENGETRINYLLVENNGDCSIIADKGKKLSQQDIIRLGENLNKYINDGDHLVLSGDASNFPGKDVYLRLARLVESKKVRIYLDSSGEYFEKSLEMRPYLVKPNMDELSHLCQREIKLENSDLLKAVSVFDKWEIPVVALSLGGDGSFIKSPEGIYRVIAPKINIKNTIGCGDCFLAGFVFAQKSGENIKESARYACAVSAAAAEQDSSVGFDQDRAKELLDKVVICEI